jgi:hypothetical protein
LGLSPVADLQFVIFESCTPEQSKELIQNAAAEEIILLNEMFMTLSNIHVRAFYDERDRLVEE